MVITDKKHFVIVYFIPSLMRSSIINDDAWRIGLLNFDFS